MIRLAAVGKNAAINDQKDFEAGEELEMLRLVFKASVLTDSTCRVEQQNVQMTDI